MGLFDFLKKKTVQTETEIMKNISVSETMINVSSEKVEVNNKPISVKEDGHLPLSELLKDAMPSSQGLFPHEIIMLEYAPGFKTRNNSFQHFWYYQYSVTEPQSVLDSLYERGFVDVGDLKSALGKLKLPEIKEELKLLNQKVAGKKAELVDRLLENGNLEYLNEKYSERYFILTSKGEQELKENQYVSYLHRHRYMDVWEMNQRIAKTHYTYRDILWSYFNEQSGVHFQNFDFGFYRNIRLNMYQFIMEENKYKTAFQILCEVLSFDLSGLGNSEKTLFEWERTNPKYYLEVYNSRVKQFFPYESTIIEIAPAIATWFEEMQNILGLNDNEYRNAVVQALKDVHPPRRLFTDEECADIILAHIHKDFKILTDIYKRAEEREKARLQDIRARVK